MASKAWNIYCLPLSRNSLLTPGQNNAFSYVLFIEKGLDHALQYVAPPGGSEHQTGLAVDVIFRRNNEMIEEQTEEDPEIKWLFLNAHKFGFILRYPKGKESITGFNFEPWHFRYVGKELSTELYSSNNTLEEYYNLKKARQLS